MADIEAIIRSNNILLSVNLDTGPWRPHSLAMGARDHQEVHFEQYVIFDSLLWKFVCFYSDSKSLPACTTLNYWWVPYRCIWKLLVCLFVCLKTILLSSLELFSYISPFNAQVQIVHTTNATQQTRTIASVVQVHMVSKSNSLSCHVRVYLVTVILLYAEFCLCFCVCVLDAWRYVVNISS